MVGEMLFLRRLRVARKDGDMGRGMDVQIWKEERRVPRW